MKPRESGYLNAMAAATYLVHKGVPFRTAHEKIGNAVRFALEKGVELGDLTLDELRQFGEEFAEDFYRRRHPRSHARLPRRDRRNRARARAQGARPTHASIAIAALATHQSQEAVHAGA